MKSGTFTSSNAHGKRAIARALKPKKCAMCGASFDPRSSFQRVCSHVCGIRFARRANERRERRAELDERRGRRARLEQLKTIPKLTKEAQQAFNAWIRWRDRDQPCICCGRMPAGDPLTGGNWDAGHYRSTGAAPHLRFNEDNCHRQMALCNRHGSGRAVDYRIGLIQRIGLERVEMLERNNDVRKWTGDQLRWIRDTYRRRLREAKKSCNHNGD